MAVQKRLPPGDGLGILAPLEHASFTRAHALPGRAAGEQIGHVRRREYQAVRPRVAEAEPAARRAVLPPLIRVVDDPENVEAIARAVNAHLDATARRARLDGPKSEPLRLELAAESPDLIR